MRSATVKQTRRLGKALGALLAPGDVVLLEGELGAGKTALTQGIGAGLGVRAVINSPTFTILKEYTGRLPLYHFDLYRIETPDEVYALGFEDYFSGEGVCVVEWAERGEPEAEAPAPWPNDYLRVRMLAQGTEGRLIEVTSAGLRGAALQAAWTRAAIAAIEEP
jgi:tRNA threonylcarbamoyladenosine biosynthesis protein TsaE